MLRILFFVFFLAALSGCARDQVTAENINSSQVYQGYPCFDSCQSFQAGYDTAKNNQLSSSADCQSLDQALQLGCQAYLNDLDYEHNDNGGFVFNP